MDNAGIIALANLLQLLIPLGIKAYNEIQAAHSGELEPIDDILNAADLNFQAVVDTAKAELGKIPPGPAQPPVIEP